MVKIAHDVAAGPGQPVGHPHELGQGAAPHLPHDLAFTVISLRSSSASDLTDAGIMVRPHKTINTKGTARIFEWTSALKQAVEQAKAARPIDFSPWLFCTSKGDGYFNEDSGQATGWDSMWQRFMSKHSAIPV